MDKPISFFWFIATITSWISFDVASWGWADSYGSGDDNRMLLLMILWFVMSLVLFLIGLRLRKSSS